ncbi:MAG: hypothetical protein JWN78_2989 [Bacteroidota bacterium]|nr:hypothetical protein [Bacteroidota bacterium]
MKYLFLTLLHVISLTGFSQEWVELKDIAKETQGYIVEQTGKITYGLIKIKPYREKIIVTTRDSIIKIDPLLVKVIHKDSMDYMPLFLNDSMDFVYGVVEDTLQTYKLYRGYLWPNQNSPMTLTVFPSGSIAKHAYVITLNNKDAVIIYNATKYRKQLEYAFDDSPRILRYLDSLDKIHFYDIPEIIRHINSLYK